MDGMLILDHILEKYEKALQERIQLDWLWEGGGGIVTSSHKK
jgi:hypothetical protein